MKALAILLLAVALDRWAGEYPNRFHPVVWMGNVVGWADRHAPAGKGAQLLYGTAMALGVPLLFALPVWALLRIPIADVVLGALLLKASFAAGALGAAGANVAAAVRAGDLLAARQALGCLCSRDSSTLSAAEVVAGAVESVAENTSDSVVAPLFWFAVLGVPGALAYRAVNTLDAMVGYHGRTEYLGKASARLDDLLNLVPARLTAFLLLVAGGTAGLPIRRGARIAWRDAQRTESPNAGWPMAAMAGLLGLRLEKRGHYALGDPGPDPGPDHLDHAWKVARGAMALAFALTAALVVAR